ncbi:MAG TPA: sugar transferase [Solirubrobacteraceae bacterium]|nr:sugar transferase [Solirubrobacteraceae bacterium]
MTINQKHAIEQDAESRKGRSAPVVLPARDVRRKRPPLLSFLLRRSTARATARMVVLLVIDLAAVCGGLFTATAIKLVFEHGLSAAAAWSTTRHFLAFAYLLTALAFARLDLYSDRPRRPGFSKIATGLFQATLLGLIFSLANGDHFDSYWIFYGSFAFALLYDSALRETYTQLTGRLLEQVGYRRRAVLVGSGSRIGAVADALEGDARASVDIVGYLSLGMPPRSGLRPLGELEDLDAVIASEQVDEVIIADPDFPQGPALDLVETCHARGVTVHVAPSTMEILVDRAEFVPGESVPLFTLRPPVFDGVQFAVKRSFDLLVAGIGLVLISPVLLACAVAVRLTSRGPIIYRSLRPGIGGKPFACLKFRTMRVDIHLTTDQLEALNESSGALFKIRDDPRLTSVGRFLRRFSLDELPQLINVMRGEMSLVGPRPLPMRDFELLDDWHKKRYLVLPGVTGLWQVSGRSELDFDDLVRLDFLYLERWSVLLDLSILLKTVPAVLSRRGAY